MTKIERKTQKIFGINAPADDIAVMGSFKTGTPVYSDDIDKLQNTAYEEGYAASIVANIAPFMEEQNSIPYILSKQLAYLFQEGIPEYDENTTYYINSICKIKNKIYFSLQDNNLNHAPIEANSEWWTEFKTGGSSSLPLFSFLWSDHLLNDMQYLRADTFSWQDGNTYSLAYNKLVQEYATGEEVTEDGITFKRSANGFKIADATQEQAILDLYNTTGVAWIYLLDQANKRFKLPRTKYGFVGLRDNVGDYVPESLPSFTWAGSTAGRPAEQVTSPVNVQQTSTNFQKHIYEREEVTNYNYTNKTTGTYQDNAPVQQRATQMYLYFYVGEYSQSAVEQTAGLNAELFNGKLDLNASNLNTQGKSYVSGLDTPSSKHVDITLLASHSTYTAPANGYFSINSKKATVGQVIMVCLAKSIGTSRWVDVAGGSFIINLRVAKGDEVIVGWDNTLVISGEQSYFRFVYAEGEVK